MNELPYIHNKTLKLIILMKLDSLAYAETKHETQLLQAVAKDILD